VAPLESVRVPDYRIRAGIHRALLIELANNEGGCEADERMRKPSRVCLCASLIGIGAALAVVGGAAINWTIVREASGRIFNGVATAPKNDVALVLGTAPRVGGGRWKNPFFENRMDAAAALFRAGKVRHLLISGDNGRREYDEPTAMRNALIARGIPERAITLDYAGFRTLDSVVRARAVFGQTKLTIVTDDFHLPRALFLARAAGVDAVGVVSPRVPNQWSRKTRAREIAARIAAWLDVSVLHTKPKFFGPKVPIEIARVE
jgi:SanA protein